MFFTMGHRENNKYLLRVNGTGNKNLKFPTELKIFDLWKTEFIIPLTMDDDYKGWSLLLKMGGIFIALGLPLALRIVPPNGLYGFRTKKTLSNQEIWYKANAYSGRCFLISGIVMVIGDYFLFTYRHKLPINIIEVISGILLGAPLAISVIMSMRYLRKM